MLYVGVIALIDILGETGLVWFPPEEILCETGFDWLPVF
jgi:hypothetical protein